MDDLVFRAVLERAEFKTTHGRVSAVLVSSSSWVVTLGSPEVQRLVRMDYHFEASSLAKADSMLLAFNWK